jgi:hypothetical protein
MYYLICLWEHKQVNLQTPQGNQQLRSKSLAIVLFVFFVVILCKSFEAEATIEGAFEPQVSQPSCSATVPAAKFKTGFSYSDVEETNPKHARNKMVKSRVTTSCLRIFLGMLAGCRSLGRLFSLVTHKLGSALLTLPKFKMRSSDVNVSNIYIDLISY